MACPAPTPPSSVPAASVVATTARRIFEVMFRTSPPFALLTTAGRERPAAPGIGPEAEPRPPAWPGAEQGHLWISRERPVKRR
jgi:hypothetical protein